MRNIYSSKLNKKGQFFILSAVIIASIIVSLASVKNFVSTGDAPKKFYYYSQQLEDETAAVVDYALYSAGSTSKLSEFLQLSISKTKEGYPDIQIYACYSNPLNSQQVWCQNNGTGLVVVQSTCEPTYHYLYPIGTKTCTAYKKDGTCSSELDAVTAEYLDISCSVPVLIFNVSNSIYRVDLTANAISNSQFYFVLKMNTSAGDFADTSQS